MSSDTRTRFEKASANKLPLAIQGCDRGFKVARRGQSEGTERTYSSALFRYWNEFVSRMYPSLADWVQVVRTWRESKDAMIRRQWVSAEALAAIEK